MTPDEIKRRLAELRARVRDRALEPDDAPLPPQHWQEEAEERDDADDEEQRHARADRPPRQEGGTVRAIAARIPRSGAIGPSESSSSCETLRRRKPTERTPANTHGYGPREDGCNARGVTRKAKNLMVSVGYPTAWVLPTPPGLTGAQRREIDLITENSVGYRGYQLPGERDCA